jgi:hypothetical protein
MPSAAFEPAIPAVKQLQTYALYLTADDNYGTAVVATSDTNGFALLFNVHLN